MNVLQKTLSLILPMFTLAACQQGANMNQQAVDISGKAVRIVNGVEATGQEPFAASIVGIASEDSFGLFIFCTGSIIDDTTIVTAAHCMEDAPKQMYIVFGLGEKDQNKILRPVTFTEFHEKWPTTQNEWVDTNDIGMAHFSGGIPEGYRAAQLLQDMTVLTKDATVMLAGYGVTSGRTQAGSGVLRYTSVTIRDPQFGTTEIQLDEVKSGTCNGDSGGPALIEIEGQLYLWGVTSRGAGYCNDDGIYTVINAHSAWVTEHAAAH